MSYGRDYGDRNFLDRAANTVRGWFGHGRSAYDEGYRGGPRRGWDEGRGYRDEMPGGHRGPDDGMAYGYGGAGWSGRNPDWDRGWGGMGRDVGEGYRTGGYHPRHGAWDVDWPDDRTMPYGGPGRGAMAEHRPGRMMGGGYDRGYVEGRDFMTNQPAYDRHGAYRDDMEPGRGMGGGMMGREPMDRGRGMQGGMGRDWERGYDRGYDRDPDRGRDRQGPGGVGPGGDYGPGMLGSGDETGNLRGGTIGNYGPYSSYGIERFRARGAGGVPTGGYFTSFGVGHTYRG